MSSWKAVYTSVLLFFIGVLGFRFFEFFLVLEEPRELTGLFVDLYLQIDFFVPPFWVLFISFLKDIQEGEPQDVLAFYCHPYSCPHMAFVFTNAPIVPFHSLRSPFQVVQKIIPETPGLKIGFLYHPIRYCHVHLLHK